MRVLLNDILRANSALSAFTSEKWFLPKRFIERQHRGVDGDAVCLMPWCEEAGRTFSKRLCGRMMCWGRT